MKEFKIEKTEKGLPQKEIKTDVNEIDDLLKDITSEAESEITESKALENKNGTENFVQKIKRLEDKIIELRKMPMTEELKKEIQNKEYQIDNLVKLN